MSGFATARVFDAPGLSDDYWKQVIAEKRVSEALEDLPVAQKAQGKNLVNHAFAAYSFIQSFTGPDILDPYDFSSGSGRAALAFVTLQTIDSEPTYTETTLESVPIQSIGSMAGSTASKRFILDDIEDELIRKPIDGRNAVEFRSRWLWLPSQAVSSDIRSFTVYFRQDGVDTGAFISNGRIARIRLKDSGGSPVILTKTSSQVLLIEYLFTLVSI